MSKSPGVVTVTVVTGSLLFLLHGSM